MSRIGAAPGSWFVTDASVSVFKLGVTRKGMDSASNGMAALLNLMMPTEIGAERD
jgi:hypothetical protein